MVKAQEREALALHPKMNGARLGFLRLKPKISQQPTKPPQGGLGLLTEAYSWPGEVVSGPGVSQ
jgi:hypothetical protein